MYWLKYTKFMGNFLITDWGIISISLIILVFVAEALGLIQPDTRLSYKAFIRNKERTPARLLSIYSNGIICIFLLSFSFTFYGNVVSFLTSIFYKQRPRKHLKMVYSKVYVLLIKRAGVLYQHIKTRREAECFRC